MSRRSKSSRGYFIAVRCDTKQGIIIKPGRSKGVNLRFVPQYQIVLYEKYTYWTQTQIFKKKSPGYFPLRYFSTIQVALLNILAPNAIASCELKPFWFKFKAKLSTHLWRMCLQRNSVQVFLQLQLMAITWHLLADWSYRKFVYCSRRSEWIKQLNIFVMLRS